jgi:hypothetical protein
MFKTGLDINQAIRLNHKIGLRFGRFFGLNVKCVVGVFFVFGLKKYFDVISRRKLVLEMLSGRVYI